PLAEHSGDEGRPKVMELDRGDPNALAEAPKYQGLRSNRPFLQAGQHEILAGQLFHLQLEEKPLQLTRHRNDSVLRRFCLTKAVLRVPGADDVNLVAF